MTQTELRLLVRNTIWHRLRYIELVSLVETTILQGTPLANSKHVQRNSINPTEEEPSVVDPLDEIFAGASAGRQSRDQLPSEFIDLIITLIKSEYAGVAVDTDDGIVIYEPDES